MTNPQVPPPGSTPGPPPPVPAPPLQHPPKGMAPWKIVLIVVLALAVLGSIPCIFGLVGAVSTVVPQMQNRQQRLTCQQNLVLIATTYVRLRSESAAWQPESGTALFLGWRKRRHPIRPGEESVLVCPADAQARSPTAQTDETGAAVWDTVDLAKPDPSLCSYAGRDYGAFPLVRDADQPEPIVACTHHLDGANVGFDDGSTQFLTRADLGLAPGDPVDVGPESKSPILRKLCFRPGRAGR